MTDKITLQCPECLDHNADVAFELYQECIYPPNKPPRCIAVLVPAGDCASCGHKWWTSEAEELITEAFLETLT